MHLPFSDRYRFFSFATSFCALGMPGIGGALLGVWGWARYMDCSWDSLRNSPGGHTRDLQDSSNSRASRRVSLHLPISLHPHRNPACFAR